MRVVPAPATRLRPRLRAAAPDERAAIVERLGLAATTVTLVVGLLLAYLGQTSGAPPCLPDAPAENRGAGTPVCVNLSTVSSSRELAPALTMFADPAERGAVASVLFEALTAAPSRPGHVGSLAFIAVTADRIRQDRRLAALNERLDARPSATSLPVLTTGDVAAMKPLVVVRTPAQYRVRVLALAVLFMASFWLAHLVRWWRGTTGDPLLLPLVHLLAGLGLMMMLAVRDPLRDVVLAATMAGGVAAGCAIWVAASFIDFERPGLRRAFLGPLGAALALAVALLVFGSGPAGSGARVNLLGVQPVEAIRLLVAFSLAAYFARRWAFLREYSETPRRLKRWYSRLRLPRWKDVRPLALAVATLLLFFFLQRDLGPALVLSCVFLGLYGVARARMALVVCGFGALALGFAAGYLFGVPATVTRRVAIWLDPWENLLPGGDQISHSLWALSTGGLFGLGPGIGDPQVIPAGHTDLIVAALGEELGFVGVACVLAAFALLTWRTLRIAQRAPGDYTCFLALALTLGLAAQALVITGGALGLLPLAGVVTPFLSYGRSAMLSNFAAVAICAAVARRAGPPREAFVAPVRALGAALAVVAALVGLRAGVVQIAAADRLAARATLTQQGDGGYRYQYNPRLVAAARQIVRGTIYDRNGLAIATSRPDEAAAAVSRLRALGLQPAPCPDSFERCYPLGGAAFHLLGDANRQLNWAARNTSFVEEDFDAHLKGFDDRPEIVRVKAPAGGTITAVRRDYSELLPLVRHRTAPQHPAARRILDRDRDLHLALDAVLQVKAAHALRSRAVAAGSGRGAVVVVHAPTGELLASASYPWPDHRELSGELTPTPDRLLDRARYGLYPPGSTFKLVTAVAALRTPGEARHSTFECVRLPGGRVGGRVPGEPAPVRDDLRDTRPHGKLDLHSALVMSCNAYFARLAHRLGSTALAETAAAARIQVAAPPVETNLARTLPHAGYGQGQVVASPMRMALMAAAIANGGILRDPRVTSATSSPDAAGIRWVGEAAAAQLRRDLRRAVTSGTGRALAGHRVPIAGKTGTAQVDHDRSHAWFVGFAPASANEPPDIAFAVLVENAGYGGQVAAPLAGEIVTAAEGLKLE